MRPQEIAVTASLLATAIGCASSVGSPPVVVPSNPQTPVSAETMVRLHSFSPSLYRYRFEQTADIRAQNSTDTVPGSITSRAVFLITVHEESDSSIQVVVTVDSISIMPQGSILPRAVGENLRLDSVLTVKFSATGVVTRNQLPDSLCMYGQFVSAAREVVLPELPPQLHSPAGEVYTDTAVDRTCRAGAEIELTTTRELRDLRRHPTELAIRQLTQMQGAGLLRRDSIRVSGSVTSHGTISFATANRLPSLIQTQSTGTIAIQLGSLATVFQQTSAQTIRLEGIESPSSNP